ncbi:MAG: phosphoribosylaminoimidazolesuccinocarboxamide synthase [Pseudobdellovibrio sp.]
MSVNTLEKTNLIYEGSVKSVYKDIGDDQRLIFSFSNRYSIFDWGEMPDLVPFKGECLNLMGFSFFKYLSDPKNWLKLKDDLFNTHFDQDFLDYILSCNEYIKLSDFGLKHHCQELIDSDLRPTNLPNMTNKMRVQRIQVLKPSKTLHSWDYSQYQHLKPVMALVPLEVMYRFGLPSGNSLSQRFISNPKYLDQYSLSEIPKENVFLKKPLIDFSTKLEPGDRYLTYEQAQTLAGLTQDEMQSLQNLTLLIGLILWNLHRKAGLELWDGKLEFAFVKSDSGKTSKTSKVSSHDSREFMLVDSIGLDEMRILDRGQKISKDFLRDYYRSTQWYENLYKSKAESIDFKKHCLSVYKSEPEKLPQQVLNRVIDLYRCYTNAIINVMELPQPFDKSLDLEFYRGSYL